MQFIIEDKVFDILPDVIFGAVVIREIDNQGNFPEINGLLTEAIEVARVRFQNIKPKEHPDILPYREAFQTLGINPNKFPCSIEALSTRIAKGGSLPDINPVVNLVNAFSLKYSLPMGAHDLDAAEDDLEVRFSREGDRFIPFGETSPEEPDFNELVYARGDSIKTRKWIWRQSDLGKVGNTSKNIFLPIDGFAHYNLNKVTAAANEIASTLEMIFKIKPLTYLLDKTNRTAKL